MILVANDEQDFIKTLKNILVIDKESIIVPHFLSPGEGFKPHYHPFAREWVRIAEGRFRVTVDRDTQEFKLHNQPKLFIFNPKSLHNIEAITEIWYLVVRNRKDVIIYEDGTIEPERPDEFFFNYLFGKENPVVGPFTSEEDAETAKNAMEDAGIRVSTNPYKK